MGEQDNATRPDQTALARAMCRFGSVACSGSDQRIDFENLQIQIVWVIRADLGQGLGGVSRVAAQPESDGIVDRFAVCDISSQSLCCGDGQLDSPQPMDYALLPVSV